MLLEELINPEIKNREVNRFGAQPRGISKYKLASGAYGNVYQNRDPHLITKVSKRPSSNIENFDVYWYFIRKIIETKINDYNPYFPKIYGVTSYKQKDDQSEIRNAKIEKLEPLSNFINNKDLIIPVLLKMRKKENLMSFLKTDENFSDYNGSDLMSYIVDFVHQDISSGIHIASTNDKLYIQAITFLRNIMNNNIDINIGIDMHEGNLMFRRTPYGLQLVITDPFS